jgi:hypothetical protein
MAAILFCYIRKGRERERKKNSSLLLKKADGNMYSIASEALLFIL